MMPAATARPPRSGGRITWGLVMVGLGLAAAAHWSGATPGSSLEGITGAGMCVFLPTGVMMLILSRPPQGQARGRTILFLGLVLGGLGTGLGSTVNEVGDNSWLAGTAMLGYCAVAPVGLLIALATRRPAQMMVQQPVMMQQQMMVQQPTTIRPAQHQLMVMAPRPTGPMVAPPQQHTLVHQPTQPLPVPTVPVQQLPQHLQQHSQVRRMAAGVAPPPIAAPPAPVAVAPSAWPTAPPRTAAAMQPRPQTSTKAMLDAGIERMRDLKRQYDDRRTRKLLDEAKGLEAARDFERAALAYQQAGAFDDAARVRAGHIEGSSAAAPPTPTRDTGLAQRFIIGDRLAEGGMAIVFLATEVATHETVVWKQAHGRQNPLAISNLKLRDEAAILAIARHPRIPRLISEGAVEVDGQEIAVLIEEHIEGGDLKNQVEQVGKAGLVLPTEKVIEYIRAICEPLQHLAALPEPIYHRDLKPHNVIVHPERGPVIIDFGLAKRVSTGEDVSTTRAGSGTWTAPERDTGVSGPFTDVYSLGKMLWYILTGKVPPAILTSDDVAPVVEAGHPQWLADIALSAAWPVHQQRLQTVELVSALLEHEGHWPEGSEGGTGGADHASSDEVTTWG